MVQNRTFYNAFSVRPNHFPEGVCLNVRLHCLLGGGLTRKDMGDDLFSPVTGQAGIPMRVVRPAASSAGVWRLQPDPAPGNTLLGLRQLAAGNIRSILCMTALFYCAAVFLLLCSMRLLIGGSE